jgi:tetratricopeptide (TPR) repeat protein
VDAAASRWSYRVRRLRRTRLISFGGLIVAVSFAAWVFYSLRNDDSTLSVLVRYTSRRMGWSPDLTTGDVVRRMDRYLKKGQNDQALRVGDAWAQKYPNREGDVLLYNILSDLYLQRAKLDSNRRDEDVNRAMSYRDKALRFQSDNVYCLQKFALLSETAAELSTSQRCPQYRNAIMFLSRSQEMLKEQQQVAPSEKFFRRRAVMTCSPSRTSTACCNSRALHWTVFEASWSDLGVRPPVLSNMTNISSLHGAALADPMLSVSILRIQYACNVTVASMHTGELVRHLSFGRNLDSGCCAEKCPNKQRNDR